MALKPERCWLCVGYRVSAFAGWGDNPGGKKIGIARFYNLAKPTKRFDAAMQWILKDVKGFSLAHKVFLGLALHTDGPHKQGSKTGLNGYTTKPGFSMAFDIPEALGDFAPGTDWGGDLKKFDANSMDEVAQIRERVMLVQKKLGKDGWEALSKLAVRGKDLYKLRSTFLKAMVAGDIASKIKTYYDEIKKFAETLLLASDPEDAKGDKPFFDFFQDKGWGASLAGVEDCCTIIVPHDLTWAGAGFVPQWAFNKEGGRWYLQFKGIPVYRRQGIVIKFFHNISRYSLGGKLAKEDALDGTLADVTMFDKYQRTGGPPVPGSGNLHLRPEGSEFQVNLSDVTWQKNGGFSTWNEVYPAAYMMENRADNFGGWHTHQPGEKLWEADEPVLVRFSFSGKIYDVKDWGYWNPRTAPPPK